MDTLRHRDFEELKRDIWLALKREGSNADTHVRALLKKYNVPDEAHSKILEKTLHSYNVVSKTHHLHEGENRIGKLLAKVTFTNYLDALSYLRPINDPIVDSKMRQAFEIKDYELNFGLVTGFAFSAIIFILPGWSGKPLALRTLTASVPLLFNYYRGFRRGHDTVQYVGKTWLEYHLRKRSLVQHMSQEDELLPELKAYLQETGKMDKLLKEYA